MWGGRRMELLSNDAGTHLLDYYCYKDIAGHSRRPVPVFLNKTVSHSRSFFAHSSVFIFSIGFAFRQDLSTLGAVAVHLFKQCCAFQINECFFS
jgi:hypothetical protein